MKSVKYVSAFFAVLLLLAGLAGCTEKDITQFNDGELSVTPDPDRYINVSIEDDGLCIFYPMQAPDYRYGPTLFTNADGSIDAWFAGPGYNGQWDWIYYRRSKDGGKTWTPETVALMGTSNALDGNSVCDPGVIKIGDYYYLGYTSTIYQETGNCAFVARSKNPDGPYEKWNGESWGGAPEPIVYYDEDTDYFGAGEPSFVVRDGTLYIYITWITVSYDQYTRVYTADAASENWPATMEYKGDAIEHKKCDSLDIKYVEDFGKFIGIAATDRMTENSKLTFYQSDDGLTFQLCAEISENTAVGAHNCGISARPNGHIRLSDDIYIGYAYGVGSENWANWATRLQKVTLYQADSVQSAVTGRGNDYGEESYTVDSVEYLAGLYADDLRLVAGGDTRTLSVLWVDGAHGNQALTDKQKKNMKVTVWDESIATVDQKTLEVTPLKAGFTHITVELEHFSYDAALYVYENAAGEKDKTILRIEPSHSSQFTIPLSYHHSKQIRGMVYYADGSFEEISNMRFQIGDSSICTVDNKGFIHVKGVGSTEITVKYKGDEVFKVTVTVTE